MSGSRSTARILRGAGDAAAQRRRQRAEAGANLDDDVVARRAHRRDDARQHRAVMQKVLPPGLLRRQPVPREHPPRIDRGRRP